jgi:hypothetical protein
MTLEVKNLGGECSHPAFDGEQCGMFLNIMYGTVLIDEPAYDWGIPKALREFILFKKALDII